MGRGSTAGVAKDSRLRLLFLFPWELERLGGAETSALTLAEALAGRGHRCCLAQFADKPAAPSGALVRSLPQLRYHGRYHPLSWWSLLKSLAAIARLLAEFRPQVICLHYPVWQSFPVLLFQLLPHRWKLVVIVHGDDVRVWPYRRPRMRRWQTELMRRAQAVVTTSRSLAAETMRLVPGLEPRVIANAVVAIPPQEHSDLERSFVFWAGRLEPVKGVDLLLEAWPRVRRAHPELQLWLAGEGRQRPELEGLAGEGVRFLGRLPRSELVELYQNARLTVFPSRREGLPLALLEACAGGGFCLGARVGGIPEVLEHGVSGWLTEPENAEALTRDMLEALALPQDRVTAIRAAARERVARDHSLAEAAGAYEQLFMELLE